MTTRHGFDIALRRRSGAPAVSPAGILALIFLFSAASPGAASAATSVSASATIRNGVSVAYDTSAGTMKLATAGDASFSVSGAPLSALRCDKDQHCLIVLSGSAPETLVEFE